MNKRKNQHYVPQFYLKYFSNDEDKRTINLFNPEKDLFVENAPIKNQSSKDYFYGKEGTVEEGLSKIENILAPKITKFIYSNSLPEYLSDDHFAILIFLITNDLRNLTHVEHLKGFSKLTNQQMKNFSQKVSDDYIPDIPHDMAIELSFSNYEVVLKTCLDLKFKVLVNNTNKPFFTCDLPTIKYNQFLEKKVIHSSNTGYGASGLQLFLPLNPKRCILFYDSSIYKVGNKKEKFIEITEEDVNQINILQILNCNNNVYFNKDAKESYVKEIFKRSEKFNKANELNATSYEIMEQNKIRENEQIIHLKSSDLKTNLILSKIKLIRSANSKFKDNGRLQLREKAKIIIENYPR